MKIIASDFDNTFFTKDYINNIKIINEFVDKDNMFIIVTGRNISHLLKDIKGYNIKYSYLICNDGGIIYDKNLKVIYRNDIDSVISKKIYDELRDNDAVLEPLIDTSFKLTTFFETPANAIIVRPFDANKTRDLLVKLETNYPQIHGYISENWLNITDINTSKANGIKFLEEKLNLNHNDIHTIGDAINDIPMIKQYNGYIVSNSSPELKEVTNNIVIDFADFIKKMND